MSIILADMSNEIDKKRFKQIFGHTLETLANKLINTTNKQKSNKNQIIVENIEKNKDKLFETDSFDNDWVIQPSDQRINLNDLKKQKRRK